MTARGKVLDSALFLRTFSVTPGEKVLDSALFLKTFSESLIGPSFPCREKNVGTRNVSGHVGWDARLRDSCGVSRDGGGCVFIGSHVHMGVG